jgi:prephenate dehydrogenase
MRESVCIVGLGLIGGSLGMALRRRGWQVSYVDPAVTPDAARAAGAADARLDEIHGTFVVLATPVDVAMRQLSEFEHQDRLLTSVCSVMLPLCSAAKGLRFVAGHPFAGSEKSGLAAASPSLFEGRPWFVERNEPLVDAMIAAAGANAVVVDAAEHDRVLALTSHLPQVVSTALASLLHEVDPRFVGTGARSLLRLAGSSFEVWRPVLESNAGEVDAAVLQLAERMRSLSKEDFDRARALYARAVGSD